MAYQEPRIAKETRSRLSLYLLAVAVSVIIIAALAAVFYWEQSRSVIVREERLEGAWRAPAPEFEQYCGRIQVEGLVAMQSSRALGDIVMELTATVRNSTGRTINGLEMRGAVADAQGSTVGERTLVIIPARHAALKPDEMMEVRVLIEGIKPEASRSNIRLEVTGVRVD
jgi:hypothetical protein